MNLMQLQSFFKLDMIELIELSLEQEREDLRMIFAHQADIEHEIIISLNGRDLNRAISLMIVLSRSEKAFEAYLLDCMLNGEFI